MASHDSQGTVKLNVLEYKNFIKLINIKGF